VLGVTLVGVAAALWTLVHPVDQIHIATAADDDFATTMRKIAARREIGPSAITEDDPIRKEGDTFVRTWKITGRRRESLQAVASDLVAEASRRGFGFKHRQSEGSGVDIIRVDCGIEAFEIELSVDAGGAAPKTIPTAAPAAHVRDDVVEPRLHPEGKRGRISILLDDTGQNMDLVASAARLPAEVGFAVLPFLPSSSDAARALHQAGHEIWLHLPMEPTGYPEENPGAGAVFVAMPEEEIRRAVHRAIDDVPFVVGVNNHMGSKATTDLRTMTWVMQELKGRGLAFIDSRTAVDTVAEAAARAQGVRAGRRHVFLDNDRNAEAINSQLEQAVSRALTGEDIVAIGHLAPVTIAVLSERCPGLGDLGVDLVRPSLMVD